MSLELPKHIKVHEALGVKNQTQNDARYLKLDATNSPITGDTELQQDLHISGDFTNYNKDLPDIGVEQTSDKRGYGLDYVTDKLISNCTIGSNSDEVEGSIRTNSGYYQIYLNGVWNDIVINFRFREDSSGGYELEHKPVELELWYEVMSGNSDIIGIDGKPIFQQYTTNMGAYQSDLIISGGSF